MLSLRRNTQWSSLAIVATGLLSAGPMGILAQAATEAVCLPSFSVLDNSKSQSPCLLSAYLQAACTGGQFDVPVLPAETHYTGPFVDEQNQCQCSSVTYNALSACGLCQNRTIINWPLWHTNCTTPFPGFFPLGVPQDTAIPQWAFQDVTTGDMTFNVTLAVLVGDLPESTATSQSTSSVTPTSTDTSALLTPTPSVSGLSGSNTNTGAIAGGVVGGVVGAALIAAAIVLAIRTRKRSQNPPSAKFTSAPTSPPVSATTFTDVSPFVQPMPQPKLYDPSDPSTFPASPPPTTIRTGSSYAVSNGFEYSTSVQPSGRYSGMPEV